MMSFAMAGTIIQIFVTENGDRMVKKLVNVDSFEERANVDHNSEGEDLQNYSFMEILKLNKPETLYIISKYVSYQM